MEHYQKIKELVRDARGCIRDGRLRKADVLFQEACEYGMTGMDMHHLTTTEERRLMREWRKVSDNS